MSQAAEKRGGIPAMLKDAAFVWEDPLDLEGELTEEERMVRDTARGYAQDKLFPRVLSAYREERFDREIAAEMGDARAARPDHSGRIRRRRPRLRRLWPDRARDRARRFRLSLGHVGAVVAGDVSDLRLRHRGAAAEISAEACHGRNRRLLRTDRARSRLRSGFDGRRAPRRCRRLSAHRQQDVDLQCAGRRCRAWSGPSSTARSAASSSSAAPRASRRRRSKASCRCAPPSPARSCSKTRSCRKRTFCRTSKGSPARSAASTMRATALPGARWAQPNSAGTARANTRSTASSSAARSRPIS